MILAALLAVATPIPARVDAVAAQAKLAGVVLVAKGDTILVEKGYGTVRPEGGPRHDPRSRWRLASITKQIVAVALLRHLGLAALDRPVDTADWSRTTLGSLTLRQLLTHHSGLANPDDTPANKDGVPGFYTKSAPDIDYCLSRKPTPGAAFAYNNCDYIIAGMQLGGALAWSGVLPRGIRLPEQGNSGIPGFISGKPEPEIDLGSWFTAGMLTGTARDVFRFDRAVMAGKLLSPAARAELWKPEGNGSYQALGQWVFPGQLKGCAAPKRIVQRDGEIEGVQTRNFILPDDDIVVIVFTNRSSDDVALGEVWQGKGFIHDLLSAVAC